MQTRGCDSFVSPSISALNETSGPSSKPPAASISCGWQSDDWIDTNYLTVCAKFLKANADYVLASGSVQYLADGEDFRHAAAGADLSSPDPANRVLEYYNSVLDNSAFYGVTRREFLTRLPIHRTMGSDWFMMASLVAWGKIQTLPDAKLHRSAAGVSRDTPSMIRYYGLAGWAARQPFGPVAIHAAEDIVVEITRTSPSIQLDNACVSECPRLRDHNWTVCRSQRESVLLRQPVGDHASPGVCRDSRVSSTARRTKFWEQDGLTSMKMFSAPCR